MVLIIPWNRRLSSTSEVLDLVLKEKKEEEEEEELEMEIKLEVGGKGKAADFGWAGWVKRGKLFSGAGGGC